MGFRHELEIKKYMDASYNGYWNDEVAEELRGRANAIYVELNRVYEQKENLSDRVNNGEDVSEGTRVLSVRMLDELDSLSINFGFLVDMMDGNEVAVNYGGVPWTTYFKDYLDELYDLGDVLLGDGEKFLLFK